MDEELILTKEMVLKFRELEIEVAWEKITAIEDAAVEHLDRLPVHLEVVRLTHLSDAFAKVLSRCGGGSINLRGLNVLSDEAARCLSQSRRTLRLDGLKTVSETAAEYFIHHRGQLTLMGVQILSEQAANSLSKRQTPVYPERVTRPMNRPAEIAGWVRKLEHEIDQQADTEGQIDPDRQRRLDDLFRSMP